MKMDSKKKDKHLNKITNQLEESNHLLRRMSNLVANYNFELCSTVILRDVYKFLQKMDLEKNDTD